MVDKNRGEGIAFTVYYVRTRRDALALACVSLQFLEFVLRLLESYSEGRKLIFEIFTSFLASNF